MIIGDGDDFEWESAEEIFDFLFMEETLAFVFGDNGVFCDCAREIKPFRGVGFVEVFVALECGAGIKAHEWNL